jgi:hypothetical protein
MTSIYIHHRIEAAPLRWRAAADAMVERKGRLAADRGALYGIWRSQIGRPRDELTAITVWPPSVSVEAAQHALVDGMEDVLTAHSSAMAPTLRPVDHQPPVRQGNYAFRWFLTPPGNWAEFLALCAQAWPGFEAAYDSQVVALWRCTGDGHGPTPDDPAAANGSAVRSLLLTRRPNLAMWERSKLPQGAAEAAVRDALSRRYDLCTWTVVYTTTLLTAADDADEARWA